MVRITVSTSTSVVALLVSILATHCMAQEETSLDAAVATVNAEMHHYFTEVDCRRDSPLPMEKHPAPLTVDEVIAAIRRWKPGDSPVAKSASPILQKIADSNVLPPPPRARLYHHDQWFDNDRHDRYEYRMFRYQLDVMNDDGKTGYGLVIRRGPIDKRIAMRPSEGYTWLLNPRALNLRPGGAVWTGDFACSIVKGEEGSLLAFTTHLLKTAGDYKIRAVAFDIDFQRNELKDSRLGKVGSTGMTRFEIPASKEPWQRIRYLGFEVVDGDEGLRLISQKAVQQANVKGIEILPFPEERKPYDFSLTATDGKTIDTQSLKGKVVLIDFWATWCGPCIKQMPDLKQLYEKWHEHGFEILGISYDEDAEAAKAAYKRLQIPWDLFVVPSGADNHQLWHDATTITTLPTVLLIDRQGNLHSTLIGNQQIDQKLSPTIQELLKQ